MESRSCTAFPPAAAHAGAAAAAAAAGCAGPGDAQCLLRLPTRALLNASAGIAWRFTVDGAEVPTQPQSLIATGRFAAVPIITGTNSEEGYIFVERNRPWPRAAYLSYVGNWTAPSASTRNWTDAERARLLALYPARDGDNTQAAAALTADFLFHCPSRRTARAFAAKGLRAYAYRFNASLRSAADGPCAAGCHSAELPFVFAQWDTCAIAERGFNCSYVEPTPAQRALSALMGRHWAALARSGAVGDSWPAYDPRRDAKVLFTAPPGAAAGEAVEKGWRRTQCDAADHLPGHI